MSEPFDRRSPKATSCSIKKCPASAWSCRQALRLSQTSKVGCEHSKKPQRPPELLHSITCKGSPMEDFIDNLAAKEGRSEEHTSELQSLLRISYAVFCLKKKTKKQTN